MNDKQFIAKLDALSDPFKVLKAVQLNEHYFGFDPYYREIRDAVLRAVDRVLAERSKSLAAEALRTDEKA